MDDVTTMKTAELAKLAAARGIAVDRRWSRERILAALTEVEAPSMVALDRDALVAKAKSIGVFVPSTWDAERIATVLEAIPAVGKAAPRGERPGSPRG